VRMVYCPSSSSSIAPPPSTLQADARSSGGGTHCCYCHPLSVFLLQSTPRAVARGAGCGWCVVCCAHL
jgi:hypothetical protein